MAPQKVLVTVKYSKPATKPPIYLAGSFSAWLPQEMDYTPNGQDEYEFHKEIEVEAGQEYQYKFRVGHEGDWWILNEGSPTVTDDIGNTNNLLSVPTDAEPVINAESPESDVPSNTFPVEAMESPSFVEETMDTREMDDSLFADEIVRPTDIRAMDTSRSATEESVEFDTTPLFIGDAQTHKVDETESTKESEDKHDKELAANETLKETNEEPLSASKPNVSGAGYPEPQSTTSNGYASKDDFVEPPVVLVDRPKTEIKDETHQATNGDAGKLLPSNTTSLDDTSRNGARTPDLANVAAEVADIAAILDRDIPTPPISDEEAGRIGYRRMSSTPIPEVANIAAEVADSAATIDKEEEETPAFIFDIDDGPLPETPPNEKVPRLPHERMSPPLRPIRPYKHDDTDPYKGMLPRVEKEIDPNDPSIKQFPTTRAAILEHLRLMQERLPEDEVKLDIVPQSPVIDPGRSGRLNLPPVSPLVSARRSSSLGSISEDTDESQKVLATLPININAEDTYATNGVNITSEEIATLTPSENSVTTNEAEPLPDAEDGSSVPEESRSDEQQKSLNAVEEADADNGTPVEEPTRAEFSSVTSNGHESAEGGQEIHVPIVKIQDTSNGESSPRHIGGKLLSNLGSQGSHFPGPMTPFTVGDRQLGHDEENISDVNVGIFTPDIAVQPAIPFPGIERQLGVDEPTGQAVTPELESRTTSASSDDHAAMNTGSNTTFKEPDKAKSTAVESSDYEIVQVKSRKRPTSPARSTTSIRSSTHDPKKRSVLKAFFQVLFIEWIGGFFMRLCGSRRRRQ